MSFRPTYGKMLTSDEAMPGVKVADWQPPPEWSKPLKLPPMMHEGVMVETLLFGHRSIIRVYNPDTPETTTTNTTTTNGKEHDDHVCD